MRGDSNRTKWRYNQSGQWTWRKLSCTGVNIQHEDVSYTVIMKDFHSTCI